LPTIFSSHVSLYPDTDGAALHRYVIVIAYALL